MKKGIFIVLIATTITWFLKAQAPAKKETPKYTVTMSLDEWQSVMNGLEATKNYLKSSNSPARDVTYLSDSIISPIQYRFSSQINLQIQQQGDSTKKKPNGK